MLTDQRAKQLSVTQWELTLRPGITFHDGTTLDATALAAVLVYDSTHAYAPDAVTTSTVTWGWR
jgi:MarR-like DNA-binding transcriptional regulator SgrR of sgrS sRNA